MMRKNKSGVDNTHIDVNNVLIDKVEGYVYLGQRYRIMDKNQEKNTTKNHVRLGGIRQTPGSL